MPWAGALLGLISALPWGQPSAGWLLLGAVVGGVGEWVGGRLAAREREPLARALALFMALQAALGLLPFLALSGALPMRRGSIVDFHPAALLPICLGAALLAAIRSGSGSVAVTRTDRGTASWLGLVGALALVLALGVADHGLPSALSLDFLYLLPVFALTWTAGPVAGVLLALLSAEVHGVARGLAEPGVLSPLLGSLHSLILGAGLATVAVLLGAARTGLARETAAARTDLLTGLVNRMAFLERLEGEIARASRYGRPLSIAYLDLDGFKGVNDQHGHAAGDEVLRIVAGVLRTSLRTEDVPARLGGDEFAVILPETAPDTATHVVERLRAQVEERMRGFDWPVTCSVGVVTSPVSAASAEQMVRAADELMYEVKHSGKNALRQAIFPPVA